MAGIIDKQIVTNLKKFKSLTFLGIAFGLILNCSTSNAQSNLDEIQNLIRQMLNWSDSKPAIDLLPTLDKDGLCVGFNFDIVNQNLIKLKATGFFADEFVDNYKRIIQTLDKKLKNKEIDAWDVNDMPPFSFASDVDPWCLCQDNLSWDNVEVEITKLENDKGEMKWNWGKLDSSYDPSWREFRYPFRVTKVNGRWKISYLKGFDYNDCTR